MIYAVHALAAQQKEKDMCEVMREKERKKDGRVLYKAAVEEWEVIEQTRKDAKAVATANLKKAVKAWEKKWDTAKAKGMCFTLIKPKGDPAPKAKVEGFSAQIFQIYSHIVAGIHVDTVVPFVCRILIIPSVV